MKNLRVVLLLGALSALALHCSGAPEVIVLDGGSGGGGDVGAGGGGEDEGGGNGEDVGGGSGEDDAGDDSGTAGSGGGTGGGSEPTDSGEPDSGTDAGTPDAGKTVDAGLVGDGGISYVIVIVKENHTFDNLFTGFPGANTSTTAKLSDGGTLLRPIPPDGGLYCDVSHSNTSGNTFWNNGKMNGFDKVKPHQDDGGYCWPYQSFARYQESDIPNYWAYARTFAIADNFFSTTMGPTWPGHFSTIAANAPFYGTRPAPTATKVVRGAWLPRPRAFRLTARPARWAVRFRASTFRW